ncbi:MAG TPA: site-2 protease family protein [Candidatus Sulfomarinibacteraceae bacterium]|nr:site-2 protease family protein [Candidatus Sulfomarinibacteraceae bacterium]
MFHPPSSGIALDSVDALRSEIVDLFTLLDTTLDWPQSGHVRFRGYFICDPADCFDELRSRFERHGFTPMVRPAEQGVALVAVPTVFDPPPSRAIINLILFLVTVGTTLFAGALSEPEFTGTEFWMGWPFSVSMLLILGAHELGHYFAARYHDVPVTLPYFIPFPSIIGTMGAFIRLKAPIKNRRALLDIGAAGPLAGMVFAVPILLLGLATSPVGPPPNVSYFQEGNSLLYMLAKFVVYGEFLPSNGLDVQLNQVAWAGWVGLFVTGLNLIPVGQLDGGHVSYVLFGKSARRFFWPAIGMLVGLALFTGTSTWWLWVLLLFFFGRAYAQPLDDVTPLDPRRRLVAIFTLLLFFLVFVPMPLQIVTP